MAFAVEDEEDTLITQAEHENNKARKILDRKRQLLGLHGVFAGQIAFTLLFCVVGSFLSALHPILKSPIFLWTSVGVGAAVLLLTWVWPSVYRSHPTNIILTCLVTVAGAEILAYISLVASTSAPALALGLTLSIVLALLIQAAIQDFDPASMTSFLVVALFGLAMVGLCVAFVPLTVSHKIYASLAAFLVSFLLAWDVRSIVTETWIGASSSGSVHGGKPSSAPGAESSNTIPGLSLYMMGSSRLLDWSCCEGRGPSAGKYTSGGKDLHQ